MFCVCNTDYSPVDSSGQRVFVLFAEAKLNIWLRIYGRFFLKNDFYLHYCWIKNPLSI